MQEFIIELAGAADELARVQSEAATCLAAAQKAAAAELEEARRSADRKLAERNEEVDALGEELRALAQKRKEEAAFALKEEKELERRIEVGKSPSS